MTKSVFLQEVGDIPKNRVWSFLIVHSEYDYSMKDIAKLSEIGYTTLKDLWKEFRERNIVVQTRIVGNAKMYKLNVDNPVVEKFIAYYWAVVDSVVKGENNIEEKKEFSHYQIAMPVSARNV